MATGPARSASATRPRSCRAFERAGLVDVVATPYDAPILLGGRGSVDDIVAYVRDSAMMRRLLSEAAPEQAARALDSVGDALRPYGTADGVRLGAAVWVVSGRRR